METIGLLGMGVQDGHLIFHTAPKLCLGNWKMGWPFQGIVSLWKFVNFVVFRALGKTISLSVRNCISQDWTVVFFFNKENCYVKSQRMHFLSILTDRVCWPSDTVRVASHYRMCRRVADLCVAFPCHIAVVCKVWKDFSVQTLSRFTIRLSQLTGRTHPCLVSASPACSVWLWQCCWSLFFFNSQGRPTDSAVAVAKISPWRTTTAPLPEHMASPKASSSAQTHSNTMKCLK